MRLTKIKIKNFGKLKEKELPLSKGINVIYGANESGKSTCFSFIRGLFYGFSTSSKRRIFEEALDKYTPWAGGDFAGYIELEDGKNYRISKDFSKDKDSVEVLDLDKARDITDEIDLYKYSKVAQPGVAFFNMTKDLFESTVLFLNPATAADQKDEILEKLTNYYSSRDENFSIKEIREKLIKKLEDLGNERRKKTLIGRTSDKILELKTKLEDLKSMEDYLGEKESLDFLISQRKVLENRLKNKEYLESQEIFEKVQLNTKKINALKYDLSKCDLNDYKDYENALELRLKIENLKEQIKYLQDKKIKDPSFDREFSLDYEDFDKLIKIYRGQGSHEILFEKSSAEEDKLALNKTLKFCFFRLGISAALIFAALTSFILAKSSYPLLLILPALILGIFTVKKMKIYADSKKRNKKRLKNINAAVLKYEDERGLAKKNLMILCKKYDFKNIEELASSFEEMKENEDKKRIKALSLEERKREEGLKIEKMKQEQKLYEDELKGILESKGLTDFEELRQIQERENPVQKLDSEIKLLLEKNKSILDGRVLKDLNKNYTRFEAPMECDFEKIRLLENKIGSQAEILKNQEKQMKLAQGINEGLDIFEENLEKLYFERDALLLALETLEDVDNEISKKSTPFFMQNLEEVYSEITKGRYEKIKMDENLNLIVFDKKADLYVKTSSLSSGSLYQLYFAFRLALLRSINKKLPMILDDGFIEYDDKRLGNLLKYLSEHERERQIIIFTHQKREEEVLKSLNISYNLLNLEEI